MKGCSVPIALFGVVLGIALSCELLIDTGKPPLLLDQAALIATTIDHQRQLELHCLLRNTTEDTVEATALTVRLWDRGRRTVSYGRGKRPSHPFSGENRATGKRPDNHFAQPISYKHPHRRDTRYSSGDRAGTFCDRDELERRLPPLSLPANTLNDRSPRRYREVTPNIVSC